jgi:hypothetical protein
VDEWGTSGDLTEVSILCDCGKSKQLIIALEDKTALGWCRGRMPWLGGGNFEPNCRDPKGRRAMWCKACGRVAPLRRIFRYTLEERVAEHGTEATLRRFGLLNSQDESTA